MIANIARFVILILIQVLLLNNIQILNVCHPFIYIAFLLSLPVTTPRWLCLFWSLTIGIIMDIFCNTMGMHAFASTLVGYSRHHAIKLFVSEENRISTAPSFNSFGTAPYLKYIIFLTFIHHTSLFLLEAFTFDHWWILLTRIMVSSLATILLIIGFETIKK